MRVILAHGLGRSKLSMLVLARRLERSGHRVEYFSYSSFFESYASILDRLTARMKLIASSSEEVGLIGHSFGGLLFRAALERVPELKVKHLVMLGTPNQPPRLAPRFYVHSPLKHLRNELGQLLANPKWFKTLPSLKVPYTLVSGTKGWRGRFSPFKHELNDAIVSVSETIISTTDSPILVPALHTFLMNKRAVSELIIKKLR